MGIFQAQECQVRLSRGSKIGFSRWFLLLILFLFHPFLFSPVRGIILYTIPIEYGTIDIECLSLRPNWLPPASSPASECIPPWTKGGEGRTERKPGTLYTLCSRTNFFLSSTVFHSWTRLYIKAFLPTPVLSLSAFLRFFSLTLFSLKGLSHEIDFKNVDNSLQNLA